jgi:membrane protein implicated in regulation of membrane protease activity
MLESVLVFAAQNAGNPLNLFWGLIFMVLLGPFIIWVIGTMIFFIPAAIVAGVIWFLTGNPNYTGAAFLIIAALSILARAHKMRVEKVMEEVLLYLYNNPNSFY